MDDFKKKEEYLKKYYFMKLKINYIRAELSELYEISKNLCGGDFKAVENTVRKIVEMENQKIRETDYLIELRKNIEKSIDGIDDENCKLILKYRYILNLTWEEVAEKLYFCNQYVFVLHRKALKLLNINE